MDQINIKQLIEQKYNKIKILFKNENIEVFLLKINKINKKLSWK